MKDKSDLQRMATTQAGALERARLGKFDRAIPQADVGLSANGGPEAVADHVR